MTKYLLPCNCGESIAIDSTQAGQTVSCHCGLTSQVPSMRSIQQLERSSDSLENPKQSLGWNASAGAVFAGGILVFFCGLAVGGFGFFNWSHNQVEPLPQIYIDSYVYDVDDATAEEMLDKWKQTIDMRLAPYETSQEVIARRTAKFFGVFINIGLAIGAVGMAVATSALFFMRRT